MLRRIIVTLTLTVIGVAALGLGLRAIAQAPPVSGAQTAPPTNPPTANAPSTNAPATPAGAAPATVAVQGKESGDDADLRPSADNNISFPVDI